MREIKFRLVFDGKIVGYEIHCFESACSILHTVDNLNKYAIDYHKNKFIWHTSKDQHTGLKDKYGKYLDWWENDLFKIHNSLYQLSYSNGSFVFKNLKSPHVILCSEVLSWGEDIYDFKIGNIHENKELLK